MTDTTDASDIAHGADGPNGGWLPDANRNFDNARDFQAEPDLSPERLDADRLDYFRTYFERYFNQAFVPGWGTEDILDRLAEVPRAGCWLDLGAGTTSLLWSIPLNDLAKATCVDLVPEALAVLDEVVTGREAPLCYRDVMAMYGRGKADLDRRRQAFGEYLLFDALQPWPEAVRARTFDLMTAIGLFGIAGDPESYAACFQHLRPSLAPGGEVVGADWRRSADFVRREGLDNRYVSPDLTRRAAEAADLTPLSCELVEIEGDPLYDAVVVWRLRG